MKIPVIRKENRIFPDFKRVIVRFFMNGEDRARKLIGNVMAMSDEDANEALLQILREFAQRHRNISRIFMKHFKRVKHLGDGDTINHISFEKKLLIGSFFTSEYSIESAAFFNPSIVEAPDQTDLEIGQKRVYVSFRAVGEGHISSIVFRSAIMDKNNNLSFDKKGDRIEMADVMTDPTFDKDNFIANLREMDIQEDVIKNIISTLDPQFNFDDLKSSIQQYTKGMDLSQISKLQLNEIVWLAQSHYEIHFSLDTDISERVIFPVSEQESKGIEDARFVRFTHDDGSVMYYATYTAYNGITILPKLIQTENFYDFKIAPLVGKGSKNKNLALFPRKVNGKYVMISRIDGVNNYIMFSDNINAWDEPQLLQEPKFPWEFVQMGNCGSPIETSEGWLLISHGVGPMRTYCLGASLFDLDDPTKELGRLKQPLLTPNMEEREGYVPNVVYSCGSITHNNELIIPYAMSDYASSFIAVPLDELLHRLTMGF